MDAPEPGMAGELQYYSSCGDGPKPPAEGKSFLTRLSPDEITQVYERYLRASRFVGEPSTSHDRWYSRDSSGISVTVLPHEGGLCRLVLREFYH